MPVNKKHNTITQKQKKRKKSGYKLSICRPYVVLIYELKEHHTRNKYIHLSIRTGI